MYYIEYKDYIFGNGWFVYFKPDNPRCRAIEQAGPFYKKEDAEKEMKRIEKNRQLFLKTSRK